MNTATFLVVLILNSGLPQPDLWVTKSPSAENCRLDTVAINGLSAAIMAEKSVPGAIPRQYVAWCEKH